MRISYNFNKSNPVVKAEDGTTARRFSPDVRQNVQPSDNTYVARPAYYQSVSLASPEKGAVSRAYKVYSNYGDAKDNPFPLPILLAKKALRLLKDNIWDGIGAGISNCTLTASQWVNPKNPIKSAASITGNPSKYGYTEIQRDEAVPGNIVIAKVPNKDIYHTMLLTGFADNDTLFNYYGKTYNVPKGEPLVSYSTGGGNQSSLRNNIPLSVYTDNSDGHTENTFFRYNYPYEVFLPGITVTSKRK